MKNLLQEARVAPWERERLPFLYCAGVLVWVPGIGIDCAYQAGPRERGIVPSWHSTRPQAAIPEPI